MEKMKKKISILSAIFCLLFLFSEKMLFTDFNWSSTAYNNAKIKIWEDENDFDQMDSATKVRVTANAGVFPVGSSLSVQTRLDDPEHFKKIDEQIDDLSSIEHYKSYEIKVLDLNENPISEFTDAKVWLPIDPDMDMADLKAAFVTEGADQEFNQGTIESYNNQSYYVFSTNHFSPYVLIDRISSADLAINGNISSYIIIILGMALVLSLFANILIVKDKKENTHRIDNAS